jgi:hypothetical protein
MKISLSVKLLWFAILLVGLVFSFFFGGTPSEMLATNFLAYSDRADKGFVLFATFTGYVCLFLILASIILMTIQKIYQSGSLEREVKGVLFDGGNKSVSEEVIQDICRVTQDELRKLFGTERDTSYTYRDYQTLRRYLRRIGIRDLNRQNVMKYLKE